MRNLIIITSVISPTASPLSYSPIRSIYTPEERCLQTIQTIYSAREKIDNLDVCLVECGQKSRFIEIAENNVDLFYNMYPNDFILNAPNKGAGEATMLLHVLNNLDTSVYDNVYKISGRYTLTKEFDIAQFNNSEIVGKVTRQYGGLGLHTFFYKFPKSEIAHWKVALEQFIASEQEIPLEAHMFKYILNKPFANVDYKLGVLARWSVYASENIL
jgi:hypothetical protein